MFKNEGAAQVQADPGEGEAPWGGWKKALREMSPGGMEGKGVPPVSTRPLQRVRCPGRTRYE